MYYRIPCFKNEDELRSTLSDAILLLNCTRRQLNIVASGRGLIGGLILLQVTPARTASQVRLLTTDRKTAIGWTATQATDI